MSKPMGVATIYALVEPTTGELRYIGKADVPEKRLKTHIRDARTRSRPVHAWINRLMRQGHAPEMVIIQEGCADWGAAESGYIARARAAGHRLLNVANGGPAPGTNAKTLRANAEAACKNRRESDGARGYWRMTREAGQTIHTLNKLGMHKKAEELSAAMSRLKARSVEQREQVGLVWLQRHPE